MKKKVLLLLLCLSVLSNSTGCSITELPDQIAEVKDQTQDDVDALKGGVSYLKHFYNVVRGIDDSSEYGAAADEDGLTQLEDNLDSLSTQIEEGVTNSYYYIEDGEGFASGDGTLHAVSLKYVIDGDTIMIDNNGSEEKVRFIGIDTPESVNADASKNNEYGEMASEYTKSILEAYDTVYLQYDEQTTDEYGRTLAYVWLTNDVDLYDIDDIGCYMLNAKLVADGYAYDKVYEPNHAYANIFNAYRLEAEEETRGLWQYEGFAKLW